MFDFQTNIKRQIEILGLSISNGKKYKTIDLADMFGVEELTIKRDLQDMRSYGIDIHSSRINGICLSTKLDKEKLKEIIFHFVGLCYTEQSLDRSTNLLVEKQGPAALENFVLLQLCIDNTLIARINYWNEEDTNYEEREIKPLMVFQNEGSWRVLVQADDIVKQFLLDKIKDVQVTNRKFKRISEKNFDDLFSCAWKAWIGKERFNVKLHISKEWAVRIKPRLLLGNQKITDEEDGSIVFEATVNSLNEIASWIVSRGKGIVVLEPEELKRKVIYFAKGALENY